MIWETQDPFNQSAALEMGKYNFIWHKGNCGSFDDRIGIEVVLNVTKYSETCQGINCAIYLFCLYLQLENTALSFLLNQLHPKCY